MKCMKCGAQLNDNANFCKQCGAPVSSEVICPSCGAGMQAGQIFCTSCGIKLDDLAFSSAGQQDVGENIRKPEEKRTGKQIRKMSGVTYFVGEPAIGVANKLGTLTVYDDRVEFVQKAGLSLVKTFSALSKAETETYYYSDVETVTTGMYLAMYTTLVLKLKNGNKVSFCPAIPLSKDMETVANLLIHYI